MRPSGMHTAGMLNRWWWFCRTSCMRCGRRLPHLGFLSLDSDRDLRLLPSTTTGPVFCCLCGWREDSDSPVGRLFDPVADGTFTLSTALLFFGGSLLFRRREPKSRGCSSADSSLTIRASILRAFHVFPFRVSATLCAVSEVRKVANAWPLVWLFDPRGTSIL